MVSLGGLEEDYHRYADEGEQGSHRTHVQRNQQTGDGSTDVGTHDDPDCLLQGHHTGVYEAHHHNSGCGGGLDDCGDDRTHQNTQNAIGSEFFQNRLHSVTGSSLQAAAHHLHAVQEQGQTAQKTEDVGYLHVKNAPFFVISFYDLILIAFR